MISGNYVELLQQAGPETLVSVAALAVLFVDLGVMRSEPARNRRLIAAAVSAFGCLAALLWTFNMPLPHAVAPGLLVVDPLTQLVKQVLLVLTLFTAAISLDAAFTDHVGEYFSLLLLATVGMMFLVSSDDILMVFVSLELTSLSLYILTAFNKRNPRSAEAALKYFLFGGMAAAFTLFGLSLLYGLSGTTSLAGISAGLRGKGLDPLLAVALVMTVIGFGFKIAAVPFHLWAPDTYQGAPIPVAALIASGSKVASFFIFAKVMMVGFAGVEGSGSWGALVPGWVPVLAVMAVFSMLLGNLGAIAQSSVRRLLAYSAIAHGGYMLLGLLAAGHAPTRHQGIAAVVYYAATYGLTTVGAFGVVAAVGGAGERDGLRDFAGLSRRAPALSLCLLVFMLSLAGIPPLAGFFGKFYVFTAAAGAQPAHLGLLWLVIFAIAMSAVSLYYYLQVLKQVYVAAADADAQPVKASLSDQIALSLLALAVLLLGALPQPLLLERLEAAARLVAP